MNQLKAGAILSYIVLGINTLVGLLYMPYMIRMLGQSEYGLYSLVASIIGYLTILDLGFGNTIIRYTAKLRAQKDLDGQYSMFGLFLVIYTAIGLLALGAGLVLYFNVDLLFENTMNAAELGKARIMMLILCFNLAVTFPLSVYTSIVTAYERFVFQRVLNIVRILLSTAVMVAMLHMGYKAIGMVVVTTVFNILTLIINYWYARHKLKVRIQFKRPEKGFLKEVASYSFYIFLNTIMDRIYWSTGQIILGMVSGTVAVAIYSVGITLQQMYMNMSTAISGVFLPRITSMVVNKNTNREISDLFVRTGRIQYLILSFILIGFALFGLPFINLWAGEGYSQSYIITLFFFISLITPLTQNLGVTILQARNQMRFRSVLYVSIAVCSVFASIPAAREYGAVGCAAVTSLALLLGNGIIMNIYYYRKQHIDIPQFWKEVLKISRAPVLIGVLTYFILRRFPVVTLRELVIGIALFSCVYTAALWFFSMNSYEKNLIKSILPRRKSGKA